MRGRKPEIGETRDASRAIRMGPGRSRLLEPFELSEVRVGFFHDLSGLGLNHDGLTWFRQVAVGPAGANHSPALPVPARDPWSRSGQSGHRPGHARSREQYIPATADNG